MSASTKATEAKSLEKSLARKRLADLIPEPDPKSPEIWLTVHPDVTAITSLSRTTIYQEMSAGRLRSVKCGGSRRIKASDLAAWQASFDGSGELAGN